MSAERPTLQHLEALAGFFGVRTTYLLEEVARQIPRNWRCCRPYTTLGSGPWRSVLPTWHQKGRGKLSGCHHSVVARIIWRHGVR